MKVYQEKNSKLSHNHKLYDLNVIFKLVNKKPIKRIQLKKLIWILDGQKLSKNRIKNAGLKYPLIVFKENNKYIVADGIHRLQKWINLFHENSYIPIKYLTTRELQKARIKSTRKNPINTQDLFNRWEYFNLLAKAIVDRDSKILALAVHFQIQGFFCKDCEELYSNCPCEKCPDCKFARCMCNIPEKDVPRMAWELAERTLSIAELDDLNNRVDQLWVQKDRRSRK